MAPLPPRSRAERIDDTRRRLSVEPDVWVATADERGAPYLVPLSLGWDGQHVVLSAETRSRTIQNLLRSGTARLGLGPTRDVVLIDAVVTAWWSATDVPVAVADAYVARASWDPRRAGASYTYVQPHPSLVRELQSQAAARTASHPGMARGQRDPGPHPAARRYMAGLSRSRRGIYRSLITARD